MYIDTTQIIKLLTLRLIPKKTRIIKYNNEVIIMVKKTHTKLFRSSNHICFPSEHIDSIIIKKWI